MALSYSNRENYKYFLSKSLKKSTFDKMTFMGTLEEIEGVLYEMTYENAYVESDFWKEMEKLDVKIYTIEIKSSYLWFTAKSLRDWIKIYLPKFYNIIIKNIQKFFCASSLSSHDLIPTRDMMILLHFADEYNDFSKEIYFAAEESVSSDLSEYQKKSSLMKCTEINLIKKYG